MPLAKLTKAEKASLAHFGANVRAARIKAGLSQMRLAELAGVRQQDVSYIEQGKQNPSFLTMRRLASAIGTTLTELLA